MQPPPSGAAAGAATPAPSATSRDVRGCPLTLPHPPFVPPSPYPARYPNPDVPGSDNAQWYGTPELWTNLAAEGEVRRGLPDDDGNGKGFDKTLWWSSSYSPEDGWGWVELVGRRLDGPGSFETKGPGGGGFRHDTGSFMILGIEVPPGCWELTATYRGTDLSVVFLIED